MAERDYVLGTHDDEIYRLGVQHRAWRARVLDAWRRAGVGEGAAVIDFGAGPGFATMDLAEIVGPSGAVHALERSRRFLDALEAQARARGLAQVRAHEIDLAAEPLPVAGVDAAWGRWIFAFLPDPKAALAKLAAAVRPGGAIILFEYIDYQTWRLAPRAPLFERFVETTVANWRASGGEPDVGRELPTWLSDLGLKLESVRPHCSVVAKDDPLWAWPHTFFDIHLEKLSAQGLISASEEAETRAEFAALEHRPGTRWVLPLVAEIIARR